MHFNWLGGFYGFLLAFSIIKLILFFILKNETSESDRTKRGERVFKYCFITFPIDFTLSLVLNFGNLLK